MLEHPEYLNLSEAARELGKSVQQVRRFIREGKLPAQKFGLQWFVTRRAMKRFKSRGSRDPNEEDVLVRARALRENIRARVGKLAVGELLDQSRRHHL